MDVTSCATTVSYNGVLGMNLTGTIGGDSYYACAFASNYTQASKCCSPEAVHTFEEDECYSWCDLPPSMNDEIDNDPDFSMLDYMRGCLNQTGETIGPLWCRLTQAHVITSPDPTTTESSTPTSTFDVDKFCATEDPQSLISVNDPWAACGTLPNNTNHLALEACCQPAPAQWTVMHCYEYCYLPRGNVFRGLRDDRNLTDDQIMGSFKACMMDQGNGTDSQFNGLICRVNGSEIDLLATTFESNEYLMGGRFRSAAISSANVKGLLFLALSWVGAFGMSQIPG